MPTKYQVKYNMRWPIDPKWDDLSIELECIKRGGTWLAKSGATCGAGLFHHFMSARTLLWPDRYRHRWTDLIYQSIIDNTCIILMGAGSTGKTATASEYALIDYWAHPQNTIVLITTTTMEKLDLAVYGELKMLHQAAKERFPNLDGHVLENRKAISTDNLDKDGARDIRRGVIGRPCFTGSKYVGLGALVGIKQERITFIGDELQFMQQTFYDCLPNMFQSSKVGDDGEPQVKVIGSGNPKHDPADMLSIAAEPLEGWKSVQNNDKTCVWKTKFRRGVCVNLIGTDSPNFDFPEDKVPRYPRLISPQSIRNVEDRWGRTSLQFYSQCVGKMMMNFAGNRVVTRELCEQHGAFSKVIWKNTNLTRIGFLDPAWGGANADRCVWGYLEFGTDIKEQEVIKFCHYGVIPIETAVDVLPDDQIAQFIKKQCATYDIDPANFFYDSTGRGTTGAAFARVFGYQVPVPISFGDRPSSRPVRYDLYVVEASGMKRLKRCDEEYGKFVSELWFTARNIIECGQMRELDNDVCNELCMREYTTIRGNKIDVETKDETKARMGRSPDLADSTICGLEGARQRGFQIRRLGADIIESQGQDPNDWIREEADLYQSAIKSRLLTHI